MVVLGVILVVLAILVIVAAVAKANGPAALDLSAFQVDTTVLGVFIAGALTLLVLVAGLALVSAGLKRASQRRKEVKDLRKRAEQTPDSGNLARRRERTETDRPTPTRLEQPAPKTRVNPDGEPAQERVVAPQPRTDPGDSTGTRRADPDEHFESAPRER